LVQASDGNFYGPTFAGGTNINPCASFQFFPAGCGTLFKISPLGTLTTLYNFCSQANCTDGWAPFNRLIQGTDGNLYGTTQGGGLVPCNYGCGTIFRLSVGLFTAPTITSISPTAAIAGGAAFTLTVNGTNIVSGSTVTFNGNTRTTTFVSASQLTAAILASDIATAGSFNVKVTNPAPSGGTSNSVSFTVNNPVPIISSISPTGALAGGPGFTLTVNGSNFVTGSVVSFNGNARTTTFISATQLTAAILATDVTTPGSFNVTATNPTPGGGISNAITFTVQTPQQATLAIINSVNALFSQGVLNGGQDNSLVAQLQHAITLMNAGKGAAAVGNLNAFITEVNDLVSSGVLSAQQAGPLITAARAVIARLS
jgi:uncharacterized repeat protein (TIGR03803 family)